MGLVTMKYEMLKALKGEYAVPAFNFFSFDNLVGIAKAAAEKKSPVIAMATTSGIKVMGEKAVVKMAEGVADDYGINLVLHLDHGEDFDICKKCVDDGFTSVMIDGSKHPFEENIRITKEVVEYAHAHGVVVEAELGRLAGVEDAVQVDARSATFTDPDEAAEFVERTGVDSLAIAIGTSHGAYKFKGEPYLDFERLKTIHKLLPETPLVLHGASSVLQEFVSKCNQYGGQVGGAQGVPEDMIHEAVKYGICKVNVDTDLRLAMTAEIRKYLTEHPEEFDPRKYMSPARDAIKSMVQHKLKDMLNASGRL